MYTYQRVADCCFCFQYLKTTTMSPPEVVQQIRQEIFEETQLTASAGRVKEECVGPP